MKRFNQYISDSLLSDENKIIDDDSLKKSLSRTDFLNVLIEYGACKKIIESWLETYNAGYNISLKLCKEKHKESVLGSPYPSVSIYFDDDNKVFLLYNEVGNYDAYIFNGNEDPYHEFKTDKLYGKPGKWVMCKYNAKKLLDTLNTI